MTIESAKIIFEHIVSPAVGILFISALGVSLLTLFARFMFREVVASNREYEDKRKKIDNYVLEEIRKKDFK